MNEEMDGSTPNASLESIEARVEALSVALERGEIARALDLVRDLDVELLRTTPTAAPRLKELIARALEVAEQVRAAREQELLKLASVAPPADAAAAMLPSPYQFRTGAPTDHALVVSMLAALFDEIAPADVAERSKRHLSADITAALQSSLVRVFIAERDGRAAGMIRVDILSGAPSFRLTDEPRCGYIDQMWVRPADRNQRLGRRLLRLAEDWVRAQGIGHCLLHAAPKAVQFYSRLDYQSTRQLFKKL